VNAQYLESFQDRTVRIVGKITQLRGPSAILDSNGNVTITLRKDSHFMVGNYYEIIGRVKNDLSISVMGSCDFGQNIDMAAMDAVVEVSHRYRSIFYDA